MASEGALDEPRIRSSWQLITSRNFGTFFAARFFTSIGSWLHAIVSAIAAFEATGSALIVGVVSSLQFLPQIVFGPMIGRWADSGSIKFQLLLGRTAVVASSLALAIWYAGFAGTDAEADSIAVIAASAVFGVGLLLSEAGQQSVAPHLVHPDEIPAAVVLNSAPSTIGRIIGPAFGAIFIAWLGYSAAFLLGAALNAVFLLLISLVVFPPPQGTKSKQGNSMREAVRFVRADRPILLCLIGMFAIGIGPEAVNTLAPPLAAEIGGDAGTVGLLVSMTGVGSAVGIVFASTFAQRIRQDLMPLIGTLLLGGMLALCAVRMPLLWVVLAFTISGLGYMLAQAAFNTIMQLRIPPSMRGRVVALSLVGFAASRPIGSILIGAIADAASTSMAFLVAGTLSIVVAWFCRPSRMR